MYPNSVYLFIPLYLPLIPAVPPTKKKKKAPKKQSKQEKASKQKQNIKILFVFPFPQLSTTSPFVLVALGASACHIVCPFVILTDFSVLLPQ